MSTSRIGNSVAERKPAAPVSRTAKAPCEAAILWIDWYPYHVSRFRALCEHEPLQGAVAGLEMVGGTGVHKGLKFREEIPADLPVTTLFPNGDWNSIGRWQMARAVWRQLNALNPRTVFVPGYYTVPGIAAALWARQKGRRPVLMTETTEADHRRNWWRELLKKTIIRSLFDWAIAGGKAHRRYLGRLGFRADRMARFYDVVDNNFFWQRAEEIRIRHRSPELGLPANYFLFVGRLAEEKSVSALLGAYLAYREGGGNWSLVLVGGGPEEQSLRESAKQSPYAADIHFEGLKTSQELAPYYAFASCFVLPSKREPWGLVVNEAMAAGLPVIVSDACGCAEDLVQCGKNGFVFRSGSQADLTGCLVSMSKLETTAWKEMSKKSAAIVSEYSPEAWAMEVARVCGV